MENLRLKKSLERIFNIANINFNGNNPWDIQVHNNNFYQKVLAQGSLGFGESYMDGWWDCEKIDELIYRIFNSELINKFNRRGILWDILKAKVLNLQNKKRSKKVAEEHYDLSPKLYESFLDPYNQYTCGYFKDTNNLNKAQEQKLDLICKKLKLSSKDKVLDIGCGWGGFAKFASEKYGCHVTGISISDEQIKYAKEYCKGFPIEIIKSDYRDFNGKFDKILICGMIEHVGPKNYSVIMKKVHRFLKDDGLFLLHTIGKNESSSLTDPWIDKYIFPNGRLPSVKQIGDVIEKNFVLEDWHNFGTDYDKTLMAWNNNFNKNWKNLKKDYDEKFKRIWNYYLLSCAGGFRARNTQLWQIVLSKKGVKGGYNSIR
ncbi:cyclopropane fatty acyl phospholipid synthase [Candidatus Pacearchaeota archaeon]|nr:cyclopropane fatty acyl phospholipid synthase [Candidatus Pacearchaeota archaeon]